MARAKKTEEVKTEEVKTEEVKASEEVKVETKEETTEVKTEAVKNEVKAPIEAMAEKLVEKKSEKKISKKEQDEAEDQAQLDSLKDTDFKVVAKLLQDIRDDNEKQMRYVRTQLRFTQFFTVFLVMIIVCMSIGVISYVPKINGLLYDTSLMIEQTNGLMTQASGVITNLDTVTSELAKTDITGMMSDLDSLVVSSEDSMAAALEKIDAIDIESLNKAIKDLQSVVSPLAKLFGRR